MKKKLMLGAMVVMLLFGCGFKIVNNQKFYNFNIVDVNSVGDNKISFFLKNNLKDKKNFENKKIKLDIKIQKYKSIKEKNIKNQITKYEISLNLDIKYNIEGSDKGGSFTVNKSGNYNVEDQYSQTIKNENNLIESLSDKLVEDIKLNLSEITNDT